MSFNEDKTRIVHASHGFDFLGFNVRRYRDSKLLIKPSAKAVRRFRERLATEMRALRGSNAAAVIARLAPITRGWAAYYRAVVSSKLFASLDHYLFKLTYKWAKRGHANKPTSWIVDRYYGKFNRFRNDRWVFGDRDSGAYLPKLAWTGIVRHIPVKGGASPDDPDLAEYWAERRRRVKPLLVSIDCACSPSRARAARCAGTTCCPPTGRPNPRTTGNGGGATSPARRWSPTIPSLAGDPAQPAMSTTALYTPSATGRTLPA